MYATLMRCLLIGVAVFASLPAAAQVPASAAPNSEWEVFAPPPGNPTTPDSPVGPTTPEGGFSAPERVSFGEKMRERVLDQLCRKLKLKYDYSLPGDFSGTGAGTKRWLAPMPDGRLSIVDEERLSVGYGHNFTQALEQAPGVTAGIWLGGRIDGTSMVIRPLQGKLTCKEVDRLVDLRDIKTVLPFKAERIAAMKVGELWRMPFRLTVGHTESVAYALEDLAVSLSFNGTETGAATLTLLRLSDSELRFRFRVDRVEIRTKGGRIAAIIPAVEFASLGGNILANLVDRELAKQLNRYTMASLGFSKSRQQGKRVLLEYVVDPRDPAAAEAVAQALHGDFQSLVKMGWRMGTQQSTDESTEAAYLNLKSEHDERLGPAEFAAINAYNQKARSTTLNLPFLTAQSWTSLTSDDTMTRYTGVEGQIHLQRADKSHQSEYLDIPWVGPLFKSREQRDVQVVTAARKGDEYGDPIVIYLQQHGYLRTTDAAIRGQAKQISDLMALAGARGNGPNPQLAIPLDKHLPEPPPPERSYQNDRFNRLEPANRKGAMSFTLVFNQEGVKQLLAATAEDVLKAYAAVSETSPAARWLLANGRIAENGRLDYDERQARADLPGEKAPQANKPADDMRRMAADVAGIVADLMTARSATNNQARSEALAKAFGGLGESGLPHERVLRVFVQLVDPMNLTADFVATVDRPKKKGDTAMHYILKRGRPDNTLLSLAGEAKARFAEPSILVD